MATSVIPTAHNERIRLGAGKLWVAPIGTITNAFAPTGVAGQFVQGTTATSVPGNAAWLPLGITKAGNIFKTGITTANVDSAEYYYPHKIVTTAQTADMAFALMTVNLTNLRLGFNAATSSVSGAVTDTTVARLSPPLPGAETRVQVMWESLAGDFVIVIYQALQTQAISLNAAKGNNNMEVPVMMTAELPPTATASVPFDMWVVGATWAETAATD